MANPDCLFCQIAAGQIPCEVIARSDRVLAFLDVAPVRPGHTLIIPRQHYAWFDDIPADVLAEMMALAQRLAPALRVQYSVPRIALFFTGVHLAHAHAHVVPMLEDTDITSPQYIVERPLTFQSAPRMPAAELQAVAAAIRRRLADG